MNTETARQESARMGGLEAQVKQSVKAGRCGSSSFVPQAILCLVSWPEFGASLNCLVKFLLNDDKAIWSGPNFSFYISVSCKLDIA